VKLRRALAGLDGKHDLERRLVESALVVVEARAGSV
jgi:hypothetical protein